MGFSTLLQKIDAQTEAITNRTKAEEATTRLLVEFMKEMDEKEDLRAGENLDDRLEEDEKESEEDEEELDDVATRSDEEFIDDDENKSDSEESSSSDSD